MSYLRGGWAGRIWIVWAVGTAIWTWPAFRWTLEYYKKPGPEFFTAIVIAAPLVGLLSVGYAWLRKRFADRSYEALLMGAPLAAMAVAEPLATAATLAVLSSCWIIGAGALDVLHLRGDARLEDGSFAGTLGLALSGFLLLLAGLLGALQIPFFLGLTLIPILLGWRRLASFGGLLIETWRDWSRSERSAHPLVGVSVVFTALFAVSAAAVLLAPPVGYDAVNYHLPLVVSHAESGAAEIIPVSDYSYNPQAFEVLLAWAYSLGGLKAAQFLPAALLLATLALAWRIGRRAGLSNSSCFVAVGVVAAMPAVSFSVVNVKNDVMTAIFQLGCLLCFLRWREDRKDRLLLLGSLLLGSSFGVKHTALFFSLSLGLLGLVALLKAERRWRTIAAAALLSAIVVAPWYWRAYVASGSPFFPMTVGFLAGEERFRGGELRPEDKVHARPPTPLTVSIPEAIGDAHVRGYRLYESVLTAPIGLFFALFAPAPWLVRRRETDSNLVITTLLVLASLFIWMAVTLPMRDSTVRADISMRYVTAALVLGPLLLVGGVLRLWESGGRLLRISMAAFLAYSGILCWTGAMVIQNSGAQVRYLLGGLSEDQYLDGAMVQYRPVRSALEAAGPGARVLSMGACARLYHDPPRQFACDRVPRKEITRDTLDRIEMLGPFDFLILNTVHTLDLDQLPVSAELVFEQGRYQGYRLTPKR